MIRAVKRNGRTAGLSLSAALLASTAMLGMALPGAALAQAGAPSAAEEEVVVTARRREETLSRVPTAVTAFGSGELEERAIVSETDLQSSVPGFTVRETQGSNSLTFSIRGQTVDVFTGSATAVVPYFNEVQLVTGGASTFFDLESIQVLKGPQGTLFGRNATGGAILYTSVQPKNEFDGFIKVRTGNYDLREVLGAVNIPIVKDKVLLRLAGDIIRREGYQHNVFNGQDLGIVDRQSGRVSLLVKPADNLTNTLVFEADHAGGNSTAERLYSVIPGGSADFIFSPAVDFLLGPGTWAAYAAAHPNVNPNGITAYLNQDSPRLDFWEANERAWLTHHEQNYMLVNTTTYDISPDMQIKNIFGASQSVTRDAASTVGAPYLVFISENFLTGARGNRHDQFTFSDELQLQGKALNDALTYIIGAYYQSLDSEVLNPQVYFGLDPLFPYLLTLDARFNLKDRNQAVYAQGTYDFSSLGLKGLSFTAGYRYTWEEVDITHLPGGVNPLITQKATFSNPSWTLGLSYQATDALLLYVQGRRSWRSGGYNGTAPPFLTVPTFQPDINLFRPEYVRDVELGVKFAGDVLGRPAHFNLALYKQWIDNVQRVEFPTPPGGQSIAFTTNVPAAEIQGIELDASIRPADWLEIGVAGALTDAKFVEGKNTAVIFGTTYIFGPYADTPKASGAVYGVVKLPTPENWGQMRVRADVYGQTGMYFSNNANTITPGTRISGYGLVNLRYDWNEVFGSKFSFAAFVKNLLDKKYYTGGFPLATSLGTNAVAVGTPQMFGVELSYEF